MEATACILVLNGLQNGVFYNVFSIDFCTERSSRLSFRIAARDEI